MNKKTIVIGIVVLLILGLFFVFKGGMLGKVIGSSSDIPSGICKNCNVVLISIDTLRADHLPCYGYNKDTAPNICALAKESIFFKNAYSVSAWTYPSHYSMLTGLYPSSHNLLDPNEIKAFDYRTNTLQKILISKMYNTAAFTNAGYVSEVWGFGRDFNMHLEEKNGTSKRFASYKEELINWTESEAQNKKFFLFLHGYDVHIGEDGYAKIPLYLRFKFFENGSVPDACYNVLEKEGVNQKICDSGPTRANYVISQYDAALYGADEFVGQFINELKEKGIYNKTIIIITADHGERFGERGRWRHVDTVYQELVNVPFIMYIPGVEGKEIETPVSNLDVTPTILDLLGIENSYSMDGKSLLSIINGGTGRVIYSLTENSRENQKSEAHGQWFSIVDGRDKLILSINQNGSREEIYDLGADPLERKNRINDPAYSKKVIALSSNLEKWTNSLNLTDESLLSESDSLDKSLTEELKSLGYLN